MLASGGRIKPIEPFTPDEAIFYDVPYGCFASDLDGHRVCNRLVKMELLDENAQRVEIPEEIEGIFPCVEQLEHDLMRVRILESGGLYFVYVELNVNLWSPCTLYFYNSAQQRLVKLYEWNAQEVIALRILSAQGLLAL